MFRQEPHRQKPRRAGADKEGRGRECSGVGWRAQTLLRAEHSPSGPQGGAGFCVARWPSLSLAMPPTGAGLSQRSRPGKSPGAVLPQERVQRTTQLHPSQAVRFLPLPRGEAGVEPSPLHPYPSAPGKQALRLHAAFPPFSTHTPAGGSAPSPTPWRRPYPVPIRVPTGAPPASGPVQSQAPSPRYPVAKLPAPGLSRHRQGRATAEGLLR